MFGKRGAVFGQRLLMLRITNNRNLSFDRIGVERVIGRGEILRATVTTTARGTVLRLNIDS
ncbi:hypothetical protein, partial [Nocardia jinanensis]|uniref:hypothetical protein n=1 Tax=Nocardia jinanensis TaxID=382504 RepID=UPI001E375107